MVVGLASPVLAAGLAVTAVAELRLLEECGNESEVASAEARRSVCLKRASQDILDKCDLL